MKKALRTHSLKQLKAASLIFLLLSHQFAPLWALPQNPQVQAGTAAFQQSFNELQIQQQSQRAVVHWDSFSSAVGEHIRFLQPDAQSAILNRVIGGDISHLQGLLTANGQVYLLNPNGILVGANARIETAGFLASTADYADEVAFMAGGAMQFSGAHAPITVQGTIESVGGDVVLLAKTVTLDAGSVIKGKSVGVHAHHEYLTEVSRGIYAETTPSAESSSGFLLQSGSIETLEDAILEADYINVGGNIVAGERVALTGRSIVSSGNVVAEGGSIEVDAQNFMQTRGSIFSVSGNVGGEIAIDSDKAYLSGTLQAEGTVGVGGRIEVLGNELFLYGTRVNASGALGGGDIRIGGDFRGAAGLRTADTVDAIGVTLTADALQEGDGGSIVVWSNTQTRIEGKLLARGRGLGNGGQAEVSSANELRSKVFADVSAEAGEAGTILYDPKNITINSAVPTAAVLAMGTFGSSDQGTETTADFLILELEGGTGGFLIANPFDDTAANDAGAVYVLDSAGVLLSVLTGSNVDDHVGIHDTSGHRVNQLKPNYVVIASPNWNGQRGAVTVIDTSVGLNGVVDINNSLIGTLAGDQIGKDVLVLNNGNFVTASSAWNNNTGFVMWVEAANAIVGDTINATNAFIGDNPGDRIGSNLTALRDDADPSRLNSFVASSSSWNNNRGAVTWFNGTGAISGTVASNNSVFGDVDGSYVGWNLKRLSNGNFVTWSHLWNWSGASTGAQGAVTWGSGDTGFIGGGGAVSSANSLVGGNNLNHQVGSGIVPFSTSDPNTGVMTLANGDYVVISPTWGNWRGAVTFADGATGRTGVVSETNSFVGDSSRVGTNGDRVGNYGITELNTGAVVIKSGNWNQKRGAATYIAKGGDGFYRGIWGPYQGDISGTLNNTNSMTGGSPNDFVGAVVQELSGGAFALLSSAWNNGSAARAGAFTYMNPSTLQNMWGTVNANNSLVGTNTNDNVGQAVTLLTNGNYVIQSNRWNGNRGALTWASASSPVVGELSAANSLVGNAAQSWVGYTGVALTNGNYVSAAHHFDGNKGYVLWLNGATGAVTAAGGTKTVGVVDATNAMIGATAGDNIGYSLTALDNGAFLVGSQLWDNGRGAVTWFDGTDGIAGTVISDANSLTGNAAGDNVGQFIRALDVSGNAVVVSPNWNGNRGAISFINKNTGVTGQIAASNSLLGSNLGDNLGLNRDGQVEIVEYASGDFWVVSEQADGGNGRLDLNLGTLAGVTFAALAGLDVNIHPDLLLETLNTGSNVVLQANNDITVTSAIVANNPGGNGGNLTLWAGRSIFINANIETDNGNLILIANADLADGVIDGSRDAGNAEIIVDPAASLILGTGELSVTLAAGVGKTNSGVGDVTLRNVEANTVRLENQNATSLTTLESNNGFDFGTSTIVGNLVVTNTGGNITNTAGALNITGTASLSNALGDITLNDAANNFVGEVTLSAAAATLVDANDLVLAASTLTNRLTVTVTDALTQTGALVVPNLELIGSGNGDGNDFTLDNVGNDFTTVAASNMFMLSLLDNNGGFNIGTAGGTTGITTSNVSTPAVPPATFSRVKLSTTGTITQNANAAIVSDGIAFLGVGGTHSLLTANNDVHWLAADTGSVSFNNIHADSSVGTVNPIGMTLTGTLSLVTQGGTTLTQTQRIVADQLILQGGDFTLTHASNDVNTASFTNVNNVSLRDADGIELGASNVAGTLTITSAGDITNSGNLIVQGVATFNNQGGVNHAITLNSAGNTFNSDAVFVTDTGSAVSVTDTTAFDMHAITVGSLAISSGGTVTQSGNLVVSGTTTVTATGNNIEFANPLYSNNFVGAVGLNGAIVAVSDINAINLGASTVTGTYTVTAAGAISNTGDLIVDGVATFDNSAGTNAAITVNSAGNTFNSDVFFITDTGSSVNVVDTTAFDVTTNDLSPLQLANFTLTAGGNITQSVDLIVSGNTSLSSVGSDITVTRPGNVFQTALLLVGRNAVVDYVGNLNFGNSTLTGTLDVTNTGTLTDTGNIIVTGVATFDNSAAIANIALNSAGNDFQTTVNFITDAATQVTVTDVNAIELGPLVVDFLNVTANGDVTSTGAIVVNGSAISVKTSINSGIGDIILADASNDFIGQVSLVGNNITIVDMNSFTVSSTNAQGDLNIIANGLINNSQFITVMGDATFDNRGGSADSVLVSWSNHNFQGTVNVLTDSDSYVSIRSASGLDLGGLTQLNHLSAVSLGPISLGSLTVNGLTLTANGDITSTGSISVNGSPVSATTRINSGTGNIALIDLNNDFYGQVSLVGNNISIVDSNDFQISSVNAQGDLNIVSNGAISNSQLITVNGNAVFDNTSGNNDAMSIAWGNHNFQGTVSLIADTGSSVSLRSGGTIDLAQVTSGNFSLTSAGNVTQSGVLQINGTTTVSAAGQTVTLDNAGNDFVGAVSLTADSATIVDANALVLGASTLTNTLSLTAVTTLTQTAALTVPSLELIGTGGVDGNDFTLTHTGNDFTTVAASGMYMLSLLDNNGGFQIGSVGATTGITTPTQAPAVPANPFARVKLSTDDTITQAVGASIVSDGIALLSTGDYTLTDANNDVHWLAFDTTGNVNFTNSHADPQVGVVNPTGITVGGTLEITLAAGTTLTQTETINVGSLTLNGGNFVLNDATNSIGTLNANVQSLSLTSAGTLSVGTVTTTGNLILTADTIDLSASNINAGSVSFGLNDPANNDLNLNLTGINFGGSIALNARNATVTYDGAIELLASTLTGNLQITTSGAITQSGVIEVAGLTTINNAGNDVTLMNGSNSFNTIAITAENLRLASSDPVEVSSLTIGDYLELDITGDLTQTGAISVGGESFIAVTSGDAVLNHTGNSFTGALALAGDNVTLRNAQATDITTTLISNGFILNSGGDVTDSGDWVVAGGATLNVSGADVDLDSSNSSFGSLSADAENVTLAFGQALALGSLTVAGDLYMDIDGDISSSGAVSVQGTSLITANSGELTLNHSDNDFVGAVSLEGANIVVRDTNAVALDIVLSPGDFTLTAGGNVTQGGVGKMIQVLGTTTINSPSSDVFLDSALNDLNAVAVNADSATVNDSNDLTVAASTVSQSLTITAGKSLSSSEIIEVGGTALVSAMDNIALSGANLFSSLAFTTNNLGNTSISNAQSLGLLPSLTNNLVLNISGNLTDVDSVGLNTYTVGSEQSFTGQAGVKVNGTSTLNVSGSTTLDDPDNDGI